MSKALKGIQVEKLSPEMRTVLEAAREMARQEGTVCFGLDIPCSDEQHIAIALYLLNKAIALRESPESGVPTIHACLRDASFHLEEARKFWTKRAMQKRERVFRKIFGKAK